MSLWNLLADRSVRGINAAFGPLWVLRLMQLSRYFRACLFG
jgi:hypothetical protein